MSEDNELNEMNELEAQLRKSLADLEAKKLEIKKRQELEKPCVLTVTGVDAGGSLILIQGYREDWIEYLRTVPGRVWQYNSKTNAIPGAEWSKTKDVIAGMKNMRLEYAPGAEQSIAEWFYAPDFSVNLQPGYLLVKPNKRASTYGLRDIPGTEHDYSTATFKVPASEGWRLSKYFENRHPVPTVVYSDDAQAFIIDQLERRSRLDQIAVAKTWPINLPDFNGTLRGFQEVGVAFFDANGARGILADEMGLGKSPQGIAIALQLGVNAIVICPASLRTNWAREIKKFTGTQPYICVGTSPNEFDLVKIITEKPRFVIMHYDIVGSWVEEDKSYTDEKGIKHVIKNTRWPWVDAINIFANVGYKLVLMDEAHYIKNMSSNRSRAVRQIKSQYFVSLTGTPVLNRPSELYPLLYMADPVTFGSEEAFRREYTFDGKRVKNADRLHEAIKTLMLRREKKDVYEQLPTLNRMYEYYELDDKFRKVYNRVLEGIYKVLSTWSPNEAGSEKAVTNVLVQIQRLKQICAIASVDQTADLATRIFDSTQDGERPKKVLIFSQFKATCYAIAQRLEKDTHSLSFVDYRNNQFITASDGERDNLVQRFQNDPEINYLCVTEKTAKEGHNITAAMAVVFNDLFWTPAAHDQAEGRAYMRAGDPHGIDSYYAVATDTINEWILELLGVKTDIINDTVNRVNESRGKDDSIIKELMRRMKEGLWKR
jgi:SNF2 family DNA or RNA helicase